MNQDIDTFKWELTIHLDTENSLVHIVLYYSD